MLQLLENSERCEDVKREASFAQKNGECVEKGRDQQRLCGGGHMALCLKHQEDF